MALKFNWTAQMFREVMLRKDLGKQLKPNASNLNHWLTVEHQWQSFQDTVFSTKVSLQFLFKKLVMGRKLKQTSSRNKPSHEWRNFH